MPKGDYDNNNSGALFVNDRRENDNQPYFTGSGEVDHVQYWLKGWKKKSKAGKVYISIAFEAKNAPAARQDERPADDDDDLGF